MLLIGMFWSGLLVEERRGGWPAAFYWIRLSIWVKANQRRLTSGPTYTLAA